MGWASEGGEFEFSFFVEKMVNGWERGWWVEVCRYRKCNVERTTSL